MIAGGANKGGRGGRGGGGNRGGARQGGEEELDSRRILKDNKRYYIDVKQNFRGRYIKLAETTVNSQRRKSRVLLSMPLVDPFRKRLDELAKVTAAAPKPAADAKGM